MLKICKKKFILLKDETQARWEDQKKTQETEEKGITGRVRWWHWEVRKIEEKTQEKQKKEIRTIGL